MSQNFQSSRGRTAARFFLPMAARPQLPGIEARPRLLGIGARAKKIPRKKIQGLPPSILLSPQDCLLQSCCHPRIEGNSTRNSTRGNSEKMGHACFQFRTPRGQQPKNGWCLFPVPRHFPDDGGADEVVAAIGEQILGPTDVSLSNWTVRPSSGCSVVLATHTAGVSVDGYTLTLAANPPTSWCTCPRQTTSTIHCTAASWATRAPGARPRCTSQFLQTELQSCTSVCTSKRRACPTKRQERWTFTASRSWTQPWRPGRCC